jgi:hypothetical protein
MEYMAIVVGIVCIPLFLIGLFAVYKIRKTERGEREAAHGL